MSENEKDRLKEIIGEQDRRIKELEITCDKANNDCLFFINLIKDYDMDEELKKRVILQFESIRFLFEKKLTQK